MGTAYFIVSGYLYDKFIFYGTDNVKCKLREKYVFYWTETKKNDIHPMICALQPHAESKSIDYVFRFVHSNQFRTLSQENAQCSSLDIYIMLQHWGFLHVLIYKGSSLSISY